MAENGSTIEITSTDGTTFDAYHVDAQGTRRGGLVLIMEIFGVTDHIKELCDGYALEGYEVISPALFDRQQKGFEASYSDEDIQTSVKMAGANTTDNATSDVQACIDMLKARGPVFMTGYCYGGSVTWISACRCDGLAAGAGYYGRLIPEHLDEAPKCPIILHFGEHDASIPMENVEKIKAAKPDVPVYVYDAGHGFNSDRRTDYDAGCAQLARDRTLALFEAHRRDK